MSSTIQMWGNSAALRLPKQVLEESGLKVGDSTIIIAREGEVIIKPDRFRHKPFKERLAEYNGQIEVEDFDWGEPLGREML